MRHFIVAPFPPPLGGVGIAAMNLRKVIEDAGCEVVVFDTSSHGQRENTSAAKSIRSYWRNVFLLFRLLAATLFRRKRPTCYHLFVTSDLAFLRDALFLAALRIQGKRVLVHLHSKTSGEFFLASSRIPWFGRLLSMADLVFVLSPMHRDFFSRFISPAKLAVLENFVQSAEFEVGNATSSKDMLYVSRLTKVKGVWDLLEAVDILVNTRGRRDLHVTLAGAADTEENEARISDFLDEHNLRPVVTLAGLVTGPRKTALFRDNGVFLFPSRFENSPITLKEATQAGMAIICSDIPANLNIVERNGNQVTFPVGISLGLADAMVRIMDNPRLFADLLAKARSCRKFDERYAREVLAPYLD